VTRRKVLILEDEPAIRNVLYVLLAGLGCEGDIVHNSRQALASINRESFDAVLLDLRCSELPPEKLVAEIVHVQPNLVGRILVITGEVADPQILAMIEQHSLTHIPRQQVATQLWERLRPLLNVSRRPSPFPPNQ
jgi:DNA-binding NtrC family response regulator